MLTIDRPPTVGNLPPLPPYLQSKRRPGRGVIITPDILLMHQSQKITDINNNWITIVHNWMNRIQGSLFDTDCKIEIAHSHSRRYHQWLETYEMTDGIPPHIQYGGCIESGKGDPTFLPRWTQWAKETFC
jgi:hypothetical protein